MVSLDEKRERVRERESVYVCVCVSEKLDFKLAGNGEENHFLYTSRFFWLV